MRGKAPGSGPGRLLNRFRRPGAAFPGPFFRCGTHSAPGIVNDAVCDFVPNLLVFQLFEAEFEDDLFIRGQLDPLDEADQQLPVGGGSVQEPLRQLFCQIGRSE